MHKGFIDDKCRPGLKAQPVAVKLLDLDGQQGHKEWLASTIDGSSPSGATEAPQSCEVDWLLL